MVMANNPQTFGDWAVVAVRRHYRKMLKHEPAVLKDTDPEELHQMRVGMRRLRSAIAGFDQALSLPKTASAQRVGTFSQQLGELRDIDVQQETLIQRYYPQLPPTEQTVLQAVLKILDKKREKSFKNVHRALTSSKYFALKTTLEDWLENPQFQAIAVYPVEAVLPDILLPQLSLFFLHPGWLVSAEKSDLGVYQPQPLNPEQIENLLLRESSPLHDLRKMAKRTRYQMDLFTDFYGEDYQTLLTQVKQVQEILGDIQDSVVLREFLDQGLKNQVNLLLPTLAEVLRHDRLQKWSEWQPIQTLFLNSEQRSRLRQTIENAAFPPLQSHA